ncbi:transcription factor IIA subunit alpha [Podospora bellae-mahoneyi]|uniref:Transcription factor IIA subunit alpha n=1 Tax=Podospora bellae-mahoneyi TaxID=2093777 RepID=A0ABR0FV26_9PEZI|nr:transcription factor IIA subunit alpha [Podospora bellae-mahoneyi]
MSNVHVGQVYEAVIQGVIDAVRVDFEENGVEDGVLEDLKKKWQMKLSQLNVAQFPWDPKPEQPAPPAQPAAPPAPAPQAAPPPQAAYTQSTLSPQTSAQPLSLPNINQPHSNGVPVKQEPGLVRSEPVAIKQEPGAGSQPVHPGYHNASHPSLPTVNPSIAATRAVQALQNKYGEGAAASIASMSNGNGKVGQGNVGQAQQQQQQVQQQHAQHQQHSQHQQHPQQQQYQQHPQHPQQQRPQHPQQIQQQHMQRPQQGGPQQLTPEQVYQRQMQQQLQQRMQLQAQQAQQQRGIAPNNLPNAQTDGPSDDCWEAVMMRRNAEGQAVEMGRVEIDDHLHAQIAARAKQMEGGGLMLPLKQATKVRSLDNRRNRAAGGPSQVDGGEDDMKDEDLDDDAINSDLDDSDDNKEDDDEDDDMGHMMLCMYDKVQRVKNKWKCTLKDGVLTVNGKEYVFHKATGEYEW